MIDITSNHDALAAEVVMLRAKLATARTLLKKAHKTWIRVGYGASHEDVAACRDLCDRIDAALAAKEK